MESLTLLPVESGGRDSKKREYRKRIVLADDHAELLDEVRRLLAPAFEIPHIVSDGPALVAAARHCRPDAVVADVHMPGLSGIEACRCILEEQLCAAVILLTVDVDRHLIDKGIRLGIRGFVLKIDAGVELIPAIHAVLAGLTYVSSGVQKRIG